jgi:REP element-mobilizing transposase RayT
MSRRKQQDFFPELLKQARAGFGGEKTATSHPTCARPFARQAPVHVILRSERAKGKHSLWLFDRKIQHILNEESSRVGAHLMALANSGNHVHLIVRFPSPQAQKRFLRAAAGLVARLVLGAKKATRKLKEGEKFWAGRPFTRIVDWGKALTHLRRYLVVNSQEQLYQGSSQERRAQARAALARLERLGLLSFAGSG